MTATTAAVLERPESERAALAGLLISIDAEPTGAAQVMATLSPAMFTDPVHREIAGAIVAALESDKPGIAEVSDALRRQAASAGLDHKDARDLVVDLLGHSLGPRPLQDARLAAEDVREAHVRREAVAALEDALQAARRPACDPVELGQVIERLESVRTGDASGRHERATGLVALLDAWARDTREPIVRTSFAPVDNRLGGGLPIGLTGIAARPGVGKSALALQLTLGALLADPGITAVWFRGEMSNDLLARRMVACWSGIRGSSVAAATCNDSTRRSENARKVAVDLANVVGDRLQVVDPPLTPEAIEGVIACRRPAMAVVDYLQLVETAGRADRRAEIEHVIRRLAWMAGRYKVAIVVVSAIAGARTRASGVGSLGKETNLLDYSVHALLSLWADESEDGLHRPDPHPVEMRIEKNRTGRAGEVGLYFTGAGQFFTPAEVEKALPPVGGYSEFAAFSPEGVA